MRQEWNRLLFAHWQIDAAKLRPLVPPTLALDVRDGRCWVAVTPFFLSGLRPRGLPPFPGTSSFPELNVRTYVTRDGKPGVYFFSLDAASALAVAGARISYHLPYYRAAMTMKSDGDWIDYRSKRAGRPAELVVHYRPTGAPFVAAPGSLDHFLIERYALYVVHRGRVTRGDIHHPPWRLRSAEVLLERNTIPAAHAIEVPGVAPLAHYSDRQDTVLWGPTRVATRE